MQEKLINARKSAKMTQEALAKKMKVSASTISAWETGKSEPSEKEIEKLERLLNVNLKEITISSSLQNVLKFIYIIVLLTSPVLFMVYETNVSVSNFSILLSNGGITSSALNTYLYSMYVSVAILYGWYFLSMIINYIFFSIKFKLGEFITVIIETIIFGLSIKLGTFELSLLFLVPVVSGIFNILILTERGE